MKSKIIINIDYDNPAFYNRVRQLIEYDLQDAKITGLITDSILTDQIVSKPKVKKCSKN